MLDCGRGRTRNTRPTSVMMQGVGGLHSMLDCSSAAVAKPALMAKPTAAVIPRTKPCKACRRISLSSQLLAIAVCQDRLLWPHFPDGFPGAAASFDLPHFTVRKCLKID